MEQQEQYTEGFNNGYLLAKYEPKLLTKLLKQLVPSGDYLEGLFSGKEECEREYTLSQLNELARLRDNNRERDQNLELP